MRRPIVFSTILMASLALAACDLGKVTVGTTSKVLLRGQPAIKQEADFEIAARALPASLKTVEAFLMVDPENKNLKGILAEGFCQYSSGFIEDEWELATFSGDLDAKEYHSERASKAFLRCMGYASELLGTKWKRALLAEAAVVEKKAELEKDSDKRDALMWAAVGLGGAINQNKDVPAMLSQVPKAKALLRRVVAMDDASNYPDKAKRALAHIALGLMELAVPEALGGNPEAGKQAIERAIEITEGKFLLARVLLARHYGVAKQDAALFRKILVEVLQTDPAIWPEQRLANEIAHRRARRYLKYEEKLF
jgi:hypothetical protein